MIRRSSSPSEGLGSWLVARRDSDPQPSHRHGQFHDLRRTTLSKMLAKGLSKYDLMVIAGHAKFETMHQFYLAVEDNLIDRTRVAAAQDFVEILARTLF